MKIPQLEDGYTRIANGIMDALCKFRVPGESRQVLDCIIRKTYGYQKNEDWLSNSQIVKMTGLKKGNASRALSKLITHKVVIQSDNKLKLNKNYKDWVSFKTLSKMITGKRNKVVIQSDTAVIQTDNDLLSKVMDTKEKKENVQKKVPVNKRVPINYSEKQLQYQRLVKYLEDTLKTKFINYPKQMVAIKRIFNAGYTEDQIIRCITHMATKDEWFINKGFDMTTVSNQLPRYRSESNRNRI